MFRLIAPLRNSSYLSKVKKRKRYMKSGQTTAYAPTSETTRYTSTKAEATLPLQSLSFDCIPERLRPLADLQIRRSSNFVPSNDLMLCPCGWSIVMHLKRVVASVRLDGQTKRHATRLFLAQKVLQLEGLALLEIKPAGLE